MPMPDMDLATIIQLCLRIYPSTLRVTTHLSGLNNSIMVEEINFPSMFPLAAEGQYLSTPEQ